MDEENAEEFPEENVDELEKAAEPDVSPMKNLEDNAGKADKYAVEEND